MQKTVVFLLILLLTACASVTEIQKPYADKVSKEKEVESRVRIAVIYLERNQTSDAIGELETAMKVDPKSARVHEVLALALEKVTDYKRAERHFKDMLRYDSDYTRGRANYGYYLMRRGEYAKAQQQLEIVVQDIYYPQRAVTYQQLATCAEMLGNKEEMLSNYQKAIAIDGDYAPPLLELAKVEFNNSNYPGAQIYFDQYRKKVEQASAEALLLGIKLARVFQDKDAEASYVMALKNLYPRSQEYLDYLDILKQA